MDKEKIRKRSERIIDEAREIHKEVEEEPPKRVKTYGDPLVEVY